MTGKPVLNFILLVFTIPFENSLQILPQLSLIKAMAILTFLSFSIHRRDFINFIIEKLIFNKVFLTFGVIFVISSLLALEKAGILEALTNWIMWFLILAYVWFVYERESQAIYYVEVSFIIYGFVILFLIFFVQGIPTLGKRLMLQKLISPTAIAVTFTSMAIISYSFWAKTRSKLQLLVTIIFGVIVLLTGNRSIPIGFIFYIILSLTIYSKTRRMRVIVSIGTVIILFILFPFERDTLPYNMRTRIVYTFQQIYEMIIHGKTSISTDEYVYHTSIYRSSRIDSDQRNLMYREAMKIFKKNPIIGVGPGSRIFSKRYREITGLVRATHSNISEILIFYGIVGFILYIFVFYRLFRYGYKNYTQIEGKIFCATLGIFFVDGFFHGNYMDSIVVLILAMTGFKVNRQVNESEQNSQ